MSQQDAALLQHIAENAMHERGFVQPAPAAVLAEAAHGQAPDKAPQGTLDLRNLPWSSIDNPDSRDLDQIEMVEEKDGEFILRVGIADVDAYVPAGSATDAYAAQNTTSVYSGVRNFPMLPEKLSYDLTSLLPDQNRLAVIIETHIGKDGALGKCALSLALVVNKARLEYPSVSAWLDGKAPPPGRLADSAELRAQLQVQDKLATLLYEARKREGALDVDTAEVRAQVNPKGEVVELVAHVQNRAGKIVAELMIASNRSVALSLDKAGYASLRRVVKRPERWPRIVAYAAERGVTLPAEPDSRALSSFAERMRQEHPNEFPEISVALVKLIGRGEYVAHAVGEPEIGHFGLAATAYTHSTAPNRRYPDLVTQRIIKASIAGLPSPFSPSQLASVAAHCSEQGAAADKVERRVSKSAAASLLSPHVGEQFSGLITGASDKGTYVRVFAPPVEGKVIRGFQGLQVGDKVQVKLVDTNVERGFIDFEVQSKQKTPRITTA